MRIKYQVGVYPSYYGSSFLDLSEDIDVTYATSTVSSYRDDNFSFRLVKEVDKWKNRKEK